MHLADLMRDSICSDDEIGGISPFSETRAPSMESDATLVNELDAPNLRTIRPFRPGPPEANKGVGTQGQKRAKHPSNSSITINSPFLTMNGSPQRSETPSSAVPSSPQTERIRSNSDSISNKERRRGMPPPPRAIAVPARPKTNFIPPQSIRPVDEKAFKHTRGYSHDSVIDGGQNNAHAPSRSPIDTERRPGQYFRRLSSLPEHKRSSLSSARVGEAARGILYSMSTLKHPIEQYIQSIGQPGGTESKVGRALYNSSTHVTTLVNALETYEAKDDEPAVQGVIDACQSCVAAFRQVLSMLQSSLKELGPGSSAPDARYARTLVLMIYGSYVEIQFSYDILRPLLVQHAVSDVSKARSASLTSRNQPPSMSFSQNRQLNGNSNVLIPDQSQMFIQAPLGTPRSFDSTFAMPQTPGAYTSQHSDSGFDQEDTLYQKFQAAASAAMLTLPQIDREIKSAVTQNLQPSVTLKLREISSLCASGCDASRRLSKIRWEAIQDGDQNERKKFWDDTNKFTQVCFLEGHLDRTWLTTGIQLVISIAELMKSVTSEYTFPKRTMAAMGTVLRPTKDLFILMNDSAFRHMAETQSAGGMHTHTFSLHSMNTPTMMPATPLSAALGPAAQATLPLMYQYGNSNGMMGMGGYSSSSSRTATLLSSHTPSMMSTSSEIGVNFPGNGGYASSPGPRMK